MTTRVFVALFATLAASLAMAQVPPAAPSPQMPATPSMNQKGSEDLSKPAGAGKDTVTAARSTTSKPSAHSGTKKPGPKETIKQKAHHSLARHVVRQARAKHVATRHFSKKKRK